MFILNIIVTTVLQEVDDQLVSTCFRNEAYSPFCAPVTAVAAATGAEFSDCAFGFLGFAGFFFSCFAGFSFSFAPSLAANGKTNHYLYTINLKRPTLSKGKQYSCISTTLLNLAISK